MKFYLYTFLFISITLSCSDFSIDPYEKVQRAVEHKTVVAPDHMNIRLFTENKDPGTNDVRELMKMGLDFQSNKENLGIFVVIHDDKTNEKSVKEIASMPLKDIASSTGNGRYVFELMENEGVRAREGDSTLFMVLGAPKKSESRNLLGGIQMAKPNSYPYGIQEYERMNIPDTEILYLYNAREATGKRLLDGSWKNVGYSAHFVMAFYDSLEEIMSRLDNPEFYLIIEGRHQDYLVIPETTEGLSQQLDEKPDFKGFAFGVEN